MQQNSQYDQIDSETEEDPEEIEDNEAPQQYKANFVRRSTLVRKQILEENDSYPMLKPRSQLLQELEDEE